MENFEQYLMDKYPTLHPKDEEGNVLPPVCGTWCPSGWEDIVDKLCECIVNYTTKSYTITKKEDGTREKLFPPPVTIDQIKSKFAELRFYFSGGDERVRGMIEFAEHLCSTTCEVSGEPGKKYTESRWWVVLCDEEKKKRDEKYGQT